MQAGGIRRKMGSPDTYDGYAYAIIGGVGPAAFYASAVGAIPIEGSSPGIYRDPLRKKDTNRLPAN